MQAFRIPGEIGQAIGIADDLPERPRHEGRARQRLETGRQGEADTVFEAMKPGPPGSQSHGLVDRQAAIPERVDDMIVRLDGGAVRSVSVTRTP